MLKRFVTYIYQYEGGSRGSNAGFVKADIRDAGCRIQIQLRTPDRLQGTCRAYLIVGGENPVGIFAGEIPLHQGTGQLQLAYPRNLLTADGHTVGQIQAVALRCSGGNHLLSCWTDQVPEAVLHGKFDIWGEQMQPNPESAPETAADSESSANSNADADKNSDMTSATGSSSASVDETATAANNTAADTAVSADAAAASARTADARHSNTSGPADNAHMADTPAADNLPHTDAGSAAPATDSARTATARAHKATDNRPAPTAGNSPRASAGSASAAPASPPTATATVTTNADTAADAVSTNTADGPALEPTSAETAATAPALEATSANTADTPPTPAPVPTTATVTVDTAPASPPSVGIADAPTPAEENLISFGVTPEPLSAEEMQADITPPPQAPQSSPAAADTKKAQGADCPCLHRPQQERPEQQTTPPEITCEKIAISDIRQKLTRRNWYLCSNSFLIHGFFNYHYLLLKTVKTDGQKKCFLGVPGIYEQPERTMAFMFGFPIFEPAREQKTPKAPAETDAHTPQPPIRETGVFGYWMLQLMD